MNKIKLLLTLTTCLFAATTQAQTPNPKMKTFVDGLMKKMTIDEKLGQLNLPSSGDFTTGLAKSSDIGKKIKEGKVGGLFNIKGVEKIAAVQKVAVEESRLKIPLIFGMDVIHGYMTEFPIPLALSCTWNLAAIEQSARIAATEASADGIGWTFSPMVDISRDARWGRIAEGSGEDPFLGSAIAKAMVKGYQGDYSKNSNIMACVKHYAAYGAAEAGRDYNTTDMSRLSLYNTYLPPYKAAIDAGAGSIMASFNEIDAVPATGNKWLLDDVLRKQWGFKGFVVTDYTGINEMIDHGMGNLQQVSALALNAGVDMDMVGEGFLSTLKKSLAEGRVTQKQIDDACRWVLEAKYKLGLFDNPFKFCDVQRSKTEIYTPANIKAARAIAAESFVLLKNQNNLLPIKKSGTIAVIGPLGNNKENMPGTWSVATDFNKAITVTEGLQNALGSYGKVLYAKGSNLASDSALEANATVFGRSLGRDNKTDIQLLDEALAVANQSDIIIATLGEASEMSGESSSRTDLQIPDVQRTLLATLLKTGKPVVLVLFAGRPMVLVDENKNVPAILNVWFGGSEAGNAIADVLFGDVNPSGKLTTSFPQNVGQLPLYYSHKNTGRPLESGKWFQKFRSNYLDVSNDPLYPFGFGLSYSTFTYTNFTLSNTTLTQTGNIKATVTLKNTGNTAGYETVQLYTRQMVGSITRPVKELKDFEKVFLKAGESKEISFKITAEDLKFYNANYKFIVEPGNFKLFVGGNSRDVKELNFELK